MRIPKLSNEELRDAAKWAVEDAQDDFCPDYIRYADSYLEQHLKYDWFVWNKRKYRRADEPVSQLESYEAIGTVGGTLSKFRAYSQFENYDD